MSAVAAHVVHSRRNARPRPWYFRPGVCMAKLTWRAFKNRFTWAVKVLVTLGPTAWLLEDHAPVALPISWTLLGFFLFIFPRSCRATKSTDGRPCGLNAHGLLGACHFRSHKWQNAWRIVPASWRPPSARPDFFIERVRPALRSGSPRTAQTDPGLWGTPAAVMTTLGSLGSVLSVAVSVLAWRFPI